MPVDWATRNVLVWAENGGFASRCSLLSPLSRFRELSQQYLWDLTEMG